MNGQRGFYGKHFEPIPEPKFKRRQKPITDWEVLEEEMRGALDYNALSEDQQRVFESVIKWYERDDRDILTFGGYAGTGKSTLISIIARELETATTGGDFNIAFCAYTGKAANVLKQKLRKAGIHASGFGIGHYAGTIHSLIYKPVTSRGGEVIDWELKTPDELSQYSLIIIDEASMVDGKMLEDLKTYGLPDLRMTTASAVPCVGVNLLTGRPASTRGRQRSYPTR